MGNVSDSFEHLPLTAKQRIDAICVQFEHAWQQGRPHLDPFLQQASAEEQAILFAELLHMELEYRIRMGENPRVEDYLFHFPEHAELIRRIVAPIDSSPEYSTDTVAMIPQPAKSPPQSPPVRVKVPEKVPGYEIMEELGRGGMGVVHLARHVALNRLVALKFVIPGNSGPVPRHDRFRREAEVIAQLRHPNIVQIYDIGEAEGRCFLALEYAEAGNLRDRLRVGPIEPRSGAILLEPLVRAVQHAHRKGVIHRDIKPANILLTPGGDSIAATNMQLPAHLPVGAYLMNSPELLPPLQTCIPKLTDFGLARFVEHDHSYEHGFAAGTPSYMAPEQIRGQAEGGPAIDIWALGATFYEMLTGRPPFQSATIEGTVRLVLESTPTAPRELQPNIPRDLETICMKCLEKDPARRYPGARELAQDFRRFIDGESISTRPEGPITTLWKWIFRRQ